MQGNKWVLRIGRGYFKNMQLIKWFKGKCTEHILPRTNDNWDHLHSRHPPQKGCNYTRYTDFDLRIHILTIRRNIARNSGRVFNNSTST